jgi:hypothetical protein
VIPYIKGRCVWEQSAEENIWTEEGEIRWMVKAGFISLSMWTSCMFLWTS